MAAWPRRTALSLVCSGALLPVPARPPAQQAQDPRLARNPALARVHARDPEAARRLLDEIDRIRRPPDPDAAPRIRGPVGPTERALLEENPDLREAYQIDPQDVLLQLREIVRLGGPRK